MIMINTLIEQAIAHAEIQSERYKRYTRIIEGVQLLGFGLMVATILPRQRNDERGYFIMLFLSGQWLYLFSTFQFTCVFGLVILCFMLICSVILAQLSLEVTETSDNEYVSLRNTIKKILYRAPSVLIGYAIYVGLMIVPVIVLIRISMFIYQFIPDIDWVLMIFLISSLIIDFIIGFYCILFIIHRLGMWIFFYLDRKTSLINSFKASYRLTAQYPVIKQLSPLVYFSMIGTSRRGHPSLDLPSALYFFSAAFLYKKLVKKGIIDA